MNSKFILCFLVFSLSSCGIYRSQFDCPAKPGIGCTPVAEVLDLIVEKEEGEDLFARSKRRALILRKQEEEKIGKTNRKGKTLYLVRDEKGTLHMVEEPQEKQHAVE